MKTIGIYPGNFQPPTKAHFQSYKRLKQVVGPDTFVVTTDRAPTPEAPLNIGDKEQIWVRHGVPASSIQKARDWQHPDEVYHNFSADHTSAIFALNPTDANKVAKRKSRSSQLKNKSATDEVQAGEVEGKPTDKEVWLDSNGELNYFQPYAGNENSMKPFKDNAYVMIVDDSRIDGKPVSTSNIRQVFGSPRYTEDAKKKFFRFVFGWFDEGLYVLMLNKYRNAHQVVGKEEPLLPSETPRVAVSPTFRENVTKMVHEILKEIMDEDYSSTMSSTTGNSSDTTDMASALDAKKTPEQQRSDNIKNKEDLVKKKHELELQAKQNKQQRDQYATTVRNYDQIKRKSDRDAITAINKQISQPVDTTTNSITALS